MSQDVTLTVEGARVRTRPSANLGKDYSKPAVLLFHGFSFSLDVWEKVGTLRILSDHGFPYIAMDLPKGKASRSDKFGKKNFAEYVPFLKKVLGNFVDLTKSKVVILGASMGGGFALAFAIENPGEVSGLVLVAPSLSGIADEALEELKVPALLVWGERDNIFPVEEYGKKLKALLPNSKLLIIKNAKHAAYLDKPHEFHDLLLDFLEEIS
ncbi:MAG: alpha/beta hydrolase [Thaumarchaeota archaeon]|nr:alpha/beta hydrolase [Nitrososphaerota archaeon]